jgi:pimeloyl-ACP methyl ester carboxylesterase
MPRLQLPDTVLHYRERGTGPLALFVHGYPLDSTLWLDQLEGLSDVRRCVAIDLRGFGLSEPTSLAVLSMERLADDLAAAILALGADQADVVALSMGGYVALALLQRHPELVRSLALLDTKAGPDSEAARAGRDAAAARLLERGREALAGDLRAALLGPRASPVAQARLRSMVEGTRYETILAALEGMKQRPDRSEVLDGVRAPTLVLVGADDELTPPREAQAMASRVPGAQLTIVPAAGHLTPLEAPEAVNEALRALWGSLHTP